MAGSRAERIAAACRAAAWRTRSAAWRTWAVVSAGARRIRRVTDAQGAGETGLGRLIEVHAVSSAGDALLAVSLAGTLFFAVPIGEARGRVALYLLVTMAPFALMAPVIGPLLDRARHGRRYAIAATMLLRAFLVWVMAGAVTGGGLSLYPAAFGALVASKAYGVSRAATVPRLLPAAVTLVKANARISLAGVISGGVAAGVGAGLTLIGPEWSLRLAFLVFAAGMVLALRLPARVDSTIGETLLPLSLDDTLPIPRLQGFGLRAGSVLATALRANTALRAFSGFLTMFLAFLLRQQPIGGLRDTAGIGLVAAAAGVGSTAGTTLGSWLRARAPEVIILVVLVVTAAAAVMACLLYGLVSVVALALAAGFAQQLGKLALDAVVQRDVEEEVRTSAFARSETVLQVAWVLGGVLGLALPLRGDLGLGLAAVGLVAVLVASVREQLARRADKTTVDRSRSGAPG